MAESFTGSAKVVYGQTPSFTVKIPKAITLDEGGSAKYTVGVKGKIPSKYVVNVVPDETTVMREENDLLGDITVDVTADKTVWTAIELSEDSYTESTNNTVQMQNIDYGKFEGNLNFNISATMPVELKDASDEVKSANRFVGETSVKSLGGYSGTTFKYLGLNDIFYVNYDYHNVFKVGYYRVKGSVYYYSLVSDELTTSSGGGNAVMDNSDLEYLGESYKV